MSATNLVKRAARRVKKVLGPLKVSLRSTWRERAKRVTAHRINFLPSWTITSSPQFLIGPKKILKTILIPNRLKKMYSVMFWSRLILWRLKILSWRRCLIPTSTDQVTVITLSKTWCDLEAQTPKDASQSAMQKTSTTIVTLKVLNRWVHSTLTDRWIIRRDQLTTATVRSKGLNLWRRSRENQPRSGHP